MNQSDPMESIESLHAGQSMSSKKKWLVVRNPFVPPSGKGSCDLAFLPERRAQSKCPSHTVTSDSVGMKGAGGIMIRSLTSSPY